MITTIIENRVEKEEERARLAKEKEEEQERASVAKEKEEERARVAKEKEEERARVAKEKEEERNFELERLKLQLEAQRLAQPRTDASVAMIDQPKFDLKKLIPTFNQKEDDMSLFLQLFERQLKFLKVEKTNWVAYLLSALPSEVAKLIAREPEEAAQNYDHVKNMLLHRFKLSAEKFRQLFVTHRKVTENTWKDYHFELQSYFEGWLNELKIDDFDKLKNLMIADQIKKRIPPEVKDHFLDVWCEWTTPADIVEKLDAYDNVRSNKREALTDAKGKYHYRQKEQAKPTFQQRSNYTGRFEKPKQNSNLESRQAISCYGCGAPGVIKARCHTCNPPKDKTDAGFFNLNLYGLSSEGHPVSIIEINICNTRAAVCADTGATHSVAGEKLYHLLQKHGLLFQKRNIAMQLADGQVQRTEVLTTVVDIQVQHKIISMELLVLPHAKGNRTLLGTNFLRKAGIVLDVQKKKWYFSESPQKQQSFVEIPPEISTLLNVTVENPPEQLREDEGTPLTNVQRHELNYLLESFKSCFQPGGEPTPFIEHRMDTGNHPPVEVPPYRMNPAKKEIEKLLQEEAQLVIPTHERESILKTHHDAPMAGHYGEEGTFHRISKRYYWTEMRRYIAEYVKNCPECTRYKASEPIGTYHTSALKPFRDIETTSVAPLRRRGRPPNISAHPFKSPKFPSAKRTDQNVPSGPPKDCPHYLPGSSSRRLRSQRGRL